MSIKNKIASFFSRGKLAGETERELPDTRQDTMPEEFYAEEPADDVDRTILELPSDHALNRLYDYHRRDSGYLPMPRICMDEDGVLPPEMIEREKKRLQKSLSIVCSARLKEAMGGQKKKRDKFRRKNEEEEEEAEDEPPVFDALPYFFLSADKLYAWVIVFPPIRGEDLSREMLWRAMSEEGILYGVNGSVVDRLYRDERRYFNLFLIARGKPAFDGKNGNIVDNFPRVIERVLEVDEYDQVDYAALNLIHNVKQGAEICRLIKPTEGDPGRTVLDQEIPAKSGKTVPLPKGRNTEISEDETSLIASITGHVEFTGRSFQVKPVLDIEENVDFSTGNIKFLGDINIHGDVLSGFTVRAMGNIRVGGVIEAGSTVEAGGDLTVVKGILGDGSTSVRAHRSVFTKFIENATVYVRENLQTDCIINGNIYCDGEVQVRSGRGSIMGGRIWAAKKVSAKSIGAMSECRSAIALGGLPCTNFEREAVQRELKELEMELEKLECQLDSPAKSSLLGKLRLKLSAAELKLKQLEDELMGIKIDLVEKESGRLECGIAYPGTEVSFGEETVRLRREERQCVVKMVNGEIVVM